MFPFSSKSEVSGRARRFAPRGEIGSKRHLEQTGRVSSPTAKFITGSPSPAAQLCVQESPKGKYTESTG